MSTSRLSAHSRPTPDGKIRPHPDKIKADGIPITGLMKVFGIELDEMVKAREARGVKIEDDDLILDPELAIPPPAIRGKVTAVQVSQEQKGRYGQEPLTKRDILTAP